MNEAPMVTGGATTLKQAEDDADISTDDMAVLTVSSYPASDPEDGAACADCTWSKEGADASKFSISATGALTFKKAPNYEDLAVDSRR